MVNHFLSLYWICYNIASALCFFSFSPWGKWDLSSPTSNWTHTPCSGKQSLNHWAAREVPALFYFEQWVRLIFFRLFEPAFMREANRLLIEFSSVQSLSRVRLFATLGTAACRASITNCQSLLKLVSIELVKSIWDTSNTILTIPMTILPFLKYIFSNYLVKS